MINSMLYILGAKKGLAPCDWSLCIYTGLQRLYYVKSGSGCIVLDNGELLPFEPGKLYIMPTGMKHCFKTDPEDRIDHIYIDFFSIPPIISSRPLVYEVRRNTPLCHQVALMDSLIHVREDPDYDYPLNFGKISDAEAGSREEHKQIIHELLYMTLLLLSYERELPFTDDRMVIDTVDYIRNHFAEPITLELLAARVGLNKVYFIRRFKRVMSLTPYAYLRTYRLIRARELLTSGETFASAAEKVGYQNGVSLYYALKQKPELQF